MGLGLRLGLACMGLNRNIEGGAGIPIYMLRVDAAIYTYINDIHVTIMT